MISGAMPKSNRFLILDADERRHVQSQYLPWLELEVLDDRNRPFRCEFGAAFLPSGHVGVESNSHPTEIRCTSDLPRFGFSLIQSGTVRNVSANNRQVDAMPGECLVSRHYEGQRLRFTPGRHLVFTIEDPAIRDFVRQYYHAEVPSELRFSDISRFEASPLADIVPIIDTIIDSRASGEAGAEMIVRGWQNLLIACVIDNIPHNFQSHIKRAETPALPRVARRGYDFIKANLSNPITVADMAKAAHCSPRQLQLTFRQYFNTTPIAMLRRSRLEGAASMLANSDCPSVTEVALAFGYSNLGRFASEFRRQFGCRPSEFARFGSRSSVSRRKER